VSPNEDVSRKEMKNGMSENEAEYKTRELVVHHELKGVTPEMIDWWWDNIDTTERYNMWHPESHTSFTWEKTDSDEHIGKTHRVTETIAGMEMTLRIRWVDPEKIPVKRIYSHANAGCTLDDEDNPISWVLHEYEAADWGTKMRSTFLLPAAAPDSFVEGLRKHNNEEMAQFPVFLLALYEKAV
jgi:leucyl aminopeptidase (aminopeptidase T)